MKFMTKRTLTVLLPVIGFVWAAAVTAQVDTLKIGVVSALSGSGSEWGLAQDGGANRAVKQNCREHELSMMKSEKTDPIAMAIHPTGRGGF